MKITFIAVGKNDDRAVEQMVQGYVGRLSHYVRFEMQVLQDPKGASTMSADARKEAEGKQILAAITPQDKIVLLDERGKEHTSRGFAEALAKHMNHDTRNIVFVAGGPFGFSKAVYDRADTMMSLSKMTLTHNMVRLLFVEQLYRAFTIIRGESYHHD